MSGKKLKIAPNYAIEKPSFVMFIVGWMAQIIQYDKLFSSFLFCSHLKNHFVLHKPLAILVIQIAGQTFDHNGISDTAATDFG